MSPRTGVVQIFNEPQAVSGVAVGVGSSGGNVGVGVDTD